MPNTENKVELAKVPRGFKANPSKSTWLDPQEEFLRLGIVRLCLGTYALALVFISVDIIFQVNTDLNGAWIAWVFLKIPIFILVTAIPILGLLWSYHKSTPFDPNKSFLSLGIVWFFGILIIGLSAYVAYSISTSLHLIYKPTYKGFETAWKIFNIPIYILATIVPTFALLAANHRSEQTKLQIEKASEQNIFSNHFKNLDEFKSFCSDNFDHLKNNKRFSLKNTRITYRRIFPKSREGEYTISKIITNDIKNHQIEFLNCFNDFNNIDLIKAQKIIRNAFSVNYNFSLKLGISLSSEYTTYQYPHIRSRASVEDIKKLNNACTIGIKESIKDFIWINLWSRELLLFDDNERIPNKIHNYISTFDPVEPITFNREIETYSVSMYEYFSLKLVGSDLVFDKVNL